jgi:hypothetical protein
MDLAVGGATVDEVEAVRVVSAGSLQGAFTTLRRETTNPTGNGWAKTLSVMKLMKKDLFITASRHARIQKGYLYVRYHRLRRP